MEFFDNFVQTPYAIEQASRQCEEEVSFKRPAQILLRAEHKIPRVAPAAAKSEHQLWADKYAPQQFDDLVGAQSLVQKLTKWLKEWDAVHVKKSIKIPLDKSNPGAKAALLSGPPGIGKSTTARLVGNAAGREIFELNASDTRSKRLLAEELADVVQAGVIHFGAKNTQKKRLIIMDEVDGMSASDRGGVAELIKIIKLSRTPIICICNDNSKSSVRSLSSHCFDLRFQRPQNASIAKRLREVAAKENLEIDDQVLESIISSSGNDIRQVFNALQMWKTSTNSMSGPNSLERLSAIHKDAIQRLSSFDATRFIFCESHTKPLTARDEAFFSDYDLIPLMISQNYVSAVQNSRTCRDEVIKMQRLSQAADAVCDSDVVGKYVRSDQHWDLLTSQAMMNVRVGHICDGPIGFPGFPEWLGKNSNATKRSRLLAELTMHIRASKSATSLDRKSVRLDYLPAMRTAFVTPLAITGVEAVGGIIENLDDYSMNRDDLFETLSELQFPEGPQFKDYFKMIQPQTKAAFTREYNKGSHRSQILVAQEGVSKKGKAKRTETEEVLDGEDVEDEQEDEEIDLDAFRAKPKKSTGKGKAEAKPKAKKGKSA